MSLIFERNTDLGGTDLDDRLRVLVTGAAGFIGSHLSARLLDEGATVTGIDNLNDYYSVDLKRDRLNRLTGRERFRFVEGDIDQEQFVDRIFSDGEFTHVINLAAQAGVPYSLEEPRTYIQSNIVGFLNMWARAPKELVRQAIPLKDICRAVSLETDARTLKRFQRLLGLVVQAQETGD